MKHKLITLIVGLGMGMGMLSSASAAGDGCYEAMQQCLQNGGSSAYCRDEYTSCKMF